MESYASHISKCDSVLVYDDTFLKYNLGPSHPWKPRRLLALIELMEEIGIWHRGSNNHLIPTQADVSLLELAHDRTYIELVQRTSMTLQISTLDPEDVYKLLQAGIGDGDTPAFAGMHEVTSTVVGGTIQALEKVINGSAKHGFNPGGGLHHAMRNRASGFCIYNDIAVAARWATKNYGLRILYVDFDVHHGDGVQWQFYEDPSVLTISFHESGKYLFPGTGFIYEVGRGKGYGYSVNMPFEPFTRDDSWWDCVEFILPAFTQAFKPDLIISQHGCDTHLWDPLADLALTTNSIARQAKLVHELAHTFCDGRWLALGGGGYDAMRVVPRAWSIVWAAMTGQSLPEKLPQSWVERWQHEAMGPMLDNFQDIPEELYRMPANPKIAKENLKTATALRELLLPTPIRLAFSSSTKFEDNKGNQVNIHSNYHRVNDIIEIIEPAADCDELYEQLSFGTRTFPVNKAILEILANSRTGKMWIAKDINGRALGLSLANKPEPWWDLESWVYEIFILVRPNHRGEGIGKLLLDFVLSQLDAESKILFTIGQAWHWSGFDSTTYRKVLNQLFRKAGFIDVLERDFRYYAFAPTALLVRTGSKVPSQVKQLFERKVEEQKELWNPQFVSGMGI